jgi:hypothetical protein
MTDWTVPPLSSSSFTLLTVPVEVQVIVCALPAAQDSPPLGVVRVRAVGGAARISTLSK